MSKLNRRIIGVSLLTASLTTIVSAFFRMLLSDPFELPEYFAALFIIAFLTTTFYYMFGRNKLIDLSIFKVSAIFATFMFLFFSFAPTFGLTHLSNLPVFLMFDNQFVLAIVWFIFNTIVYLVSFGLIQRWRE